MNGGEKVNRARSLGALEAVSIRCWVSKILGKISAENCWSYFGLKKAAVEGQVV